MSYKDSSTDKLTYRKRTQYKIFGFCIGEKVENYEELYINDIQNLEGFVPTTMEEE